MASLSRAVRCLGKDAHLGLLPAGLKAGEGHVKDAYISRNIERVGVWAWNNYLHKWEWGVLPKGYKAEVHGPYQPHVWYGAPETPLREVKLGELGAWLARRDKSPTAVYREAARMWHLWLQRFSYARYEGMAIHWQFCAMMILFFGAMSYPYKKIHKQARYHW